jgi:agmatine deiminase
MIKALSKGDTVKVLAMGDEAMASALDMLGAAAKVIPAQFGDIWLRDTGPIFTVKNNALVALRFKNNGWGGKYKLPHDNAVGNAVAEGAGAKIESFDFILEGGALEHDGAGTILTTRQCLLNKNRNPGWTQEKAEAALKNAFGARRILWLDEGLLNDHTDGHIDNIARFIAPGRVVCQSASGKNDPNSTVYASIAGALKAMGLEVIQIPSPGLVTDDHGDPVPASHMNFMIGNEAVVVPTYGTAAGDDAVDALQALFPGREVVGLGSSALLTGGGSFHCITQQEPLGGQ